MRILVAVFFLLMSSSLFSQPNSVRLFGMGNVSIAVPDIEGEVFVNPAKAARLTGVFLRFRPTYLRDSRSGDGSSSYLSGGSSYSSNYSSDNTQTDALAPVDAVISLGPLFIGGSASYQINSWNSSNESGDQNPGYSQSNRSKYETNRPSTSLSLLGAFDFGGISIGGAATLSNMGQESKSSYINSSSPGSSTSSEYEYKLDFSGTTLRAGFIAGSTETFEISMYGNLDLSKSEDKPTRSVSNGVPQPLNEAYINRNESSTSSLVAELRSRVGERLMFGGRLKRSSLSGDYFSKSRWYEQSIPLGVYEERKTGVDEMTVYEIGAGCSWQAPSGGTFSIEFVLSPTSSTSKSLFPTSGTYPDGRTYRKGDVSFERDDKSTAKTLRAGGELNVTEVLTLRAGSEVVWSSHEISSKQQYDQRTEKTNGSTSATFYASGGLSYVLSPFRFDYAIALVPNYNFPTLLFGPSFGYSIEQDVFVRHHLTLALQL